MNKTALPTRWLFWLVVVVVQLMLVVGYLLLLHSNKPKWEWQLTNTALPTWFSPEVRISSFVPIRGRGGWNEVIGATQQGNILQIEVGVGGPESDEPTIKGILSIELGDGTFRYLSYKLTQHPNGIS